MTSKLGIEAPRPELKNCLAKLRLNLVYWEGLLNGDHTLNSVIAGFSPSNLPNVPEMKENL